MQKNSPINTKKHILVHANVLKTINIDLTILEKPLKLPSHFFGLPFVLQGLDHYCLPLDLNLILCNPLFLC